MRKLATAAAVSLALASSSALGLGLGDIEMQSALNQPMSAEIPLTAVRPGELDGMIVQLASEDAFERAGINLSESLTDLQFSVDQSSGSPVIRIQSSQPVAEPFLNFLLEVDWPQGRVVREYTVLLDPPVFISPSASSRNSTADQPAVVQGGEGALVAPTPIERSPDVEPDGLDVPLVELEDAPSEPVLTLEEATTGGISAPEAEQAPSVTVADDQLLSDSATAGQVVSLTDLGDTGAAAQQQQADTQVASESSESADSDQNNPSTDTNEGAVVVSLDDLGAEQPAEIAEPVQQVEVLPGDTLFGIASENTPSGASVQQMMMAMLAANESAFINGNINLVRAGTILRIPEFGEATQITQGEALAAIAEQNQLWQDYRDSLRESANTQIAQDITDTDVVEEPAQEPDTIVEEAQEPVEVAEIEDPVETPEVIENETATGSAAESAGLSEEAREIIEAARRELEGAAELSIVAADTATDSVASATADESADSDSSSRIGEINLELQMTQEELSSARLRSEDLSDKASDLESTADNLGAMVALRQNEISQLEAQLIAAREAAEQAAAEQAAAEEAAAEQAAAEQLAAEEAAAEQAAAEQLAAEEAAAEQAAAEQLAAEEAAAEQATAEQSAAESAQEEVETAQDTLAQAGESALAEAGELADSAGAAVDEAVDNADSVAQEAAGLVDGAVEGVEDSLAEASDAVDSSVNALTEAGGDASQDGDNVTEDVPVDETATATDVAEAGDAETDATAETATTWFQELRESPIRMAIAGVGALSFLGILGTLLLRRKRDDEDEFLEHDVDRHEFDNDFADDYDESAAIASAAAGEEDYSVRDETGGFATPGIAAATAGVQSADIAAAASADEADSDDETLSEVEVYLAYGLHSQAEEMLLKATASDPDNEVYAGKLLETYHAQGNAALYHENAVDFHQRFGGNDNPQWTAIASMGSALMPNEALYAQGEQTPSSMGSDASLDDAGVFSSGSDERVSDDIGKVDDMDDTSLEADATSLMDESIDPAFLFDESDLESTGDLSSVVDEIRAEDEDGSHDASGAGHVDSGLKTPSADGVDTSLFDADSALGDTGSVDTLQDTVDDLTLDLDQLSGDLELDSAELLNGDLGDLELLDMKEGGNDFLSSASTDTGSEVEEDMEGMMDLAKAYLDIGDNDSATSTLDEIVKSGSPAQVSEAEILLRKIS